MADQGTVDSQHEPETQNQEGRTSGKVYDPPTFEDLPDEIKLIITSMLGIDPNAPDEVLSSTTYEASVSRQRQLEDANARRDLTALCNAVPKMVKCAQEKPPSEHSHPQC
jgi:hypothetical protein